MGGDYIRIQRNGAKSRKKSKIKRQKAKGKNEDAFRCLISSLLIFAFCLLILSCAFALCDFALNESEVRLSGS